MTIVSSFIITMEDMVSGILHIAQATPQSMHLQTQEASVASAEDPEEEVEELSSFPLLFLIFKNSHLKWKTSIFSVYFIIFSIPVSYFSQIITI